MTREAILFFLQLEVCPRCKSPISEEWDWDLDEIISHCGICGGVFYEYDKAPLKKKAAILIEEGVQLSLFGKKQIITNYYRANRDWGMKPSTSLQTIFKALKKDRISGYYQERIVRNEKWKNFL